MSILSLNIFQFWPSETHSTDFWVPLMYSIIRSLKVVPCFFHFLMFYTIRCIRHTVCFLSSSRISHYWRSHISLAGLKPNSGLLGCHCLKVLSINVAMCNSVYTELSIILCDSQHSSKLFFISRNTFMWNILFSYPQIIFFQSFHQYFIILYKGFLNEFFKVILK